MDIVVNILINTVITIDIEIGIGIRHEIDITWPSTLTWTNVIDGCAWV